MSDEVRIWGADAGDFAHGKVLWSVLNTLRDAKRSPVTSVGLADLLLTHPYSTAAIAAIGLLSKRKALLELPDTQDARDFILRSGLAAFFVVQEGVELSPSPRIVRVRNLEQRDPAFADEVVEVWDSELGGLPVAFGSELANHLDEMILNALAHSDSPIGCVVAGQAYPQARRVEVAVLDVGQTIRGHLARKFPEFDNRTDQEAIQFATEEGVTGTPEGMKNRLGDPNSGIGLYELRRYCENGGGDVTVLSGEESVTFAAGEEPVIRPFHGGFPGCLIYMRFSVPL